MKKIFFRVLFYIFLHPLDLFIRVGDYADWMKATLAFRSIGSKGKVKLRNSCE